MKTLNRILAASLLAAGVSLPAIAADTIVIKFNDATESTFTRWWGAAEQTYEHDATVDVDNDPASGSQKIIVGFNLAAHGGDNQFAAQLNFASAVDGRAYTNMTFDVRFDPASPTRAGADYGPLEFGLGPSDYSQIQLGTAVVPVSGGNWYRVSVPLDPTTPKMDSIARFWVKIWSGGGDGMTGTSTLWIDNISLNADQDVSPPEPPTMAIEKASSGLRLVASQPGAQYGRQNIVTAGNTGYSWVGAAGPVTYALTLAGYPDGLHTGFQTHLFLVPGASIAPSETSPDWNEPNLIFLDIGVNADGTGYASFRYKTNLPNGNSMAYGEGTLGSVGAPSPNGTWSITFNGDTAVTLTGPGGESTSFALPAEAAALFADPLYVYVGCQPNQIANIGQAVTVKKVEITGVASPVSDGFDGALSSIWQISAGDAAGILTVPPGYDYWLSWSLPDDGFTFEYAPNTLADDLWLPVEGITQPVQIGSRRWALLPDSFIPFPGEGYFFRMVKPAPAAQ